MLNPVNINQFIVADQDICHGQPTFKGSRITVWQILDLLAAGITPDQILRDYFPQLTRGAILSAINYAAESISQERYAIFNQPARVNQEQHVYRASGATM